MASDYSVIRQDNKREYGEGVQRWGRDLLATRYDDRSHFIFELLQNAEDALARRSGWMGSRTVKFTLSATELRVVHSGQPFNEQDVRGICGIAESTKDLTAIGRFGIGFKSVYAFTDRPEVHSGAEDFAIESYVWPTATSQIDRRADETIIVLPLKTGDNEAPQEIIRGLQRLGPSALLFLRQTEEIAWSVEGGPSGLYLRSKPEAIDTNVRRTTVIGQEEGKPDIEEAWLVFSREARTDGDTNVGQVEIAFSMAQREESGPWSIQAISDSPLVVFFPTVLPTHLGFLVQGLYRTTPSRDNVPRSDAWNQHLIRETSALHVDALRWLRDRGMLDTAALRCLPLDRTKFPEGSMFAPLFEAVRTALMSEPLLPCFGDGYVPARQAKLARTQELRELFNPSQLGPLFSADGELAWLSSDITPDRTPELYRYLIDELDVAVVTPEAIVLKLDKAFLEAQPDKWVLGLYEFLNSQSTLRRRVNDLPLIRVQDGTHVVAYANGQPQAFLPSAIETDFPTVRQAVCVTETAREFLRSLRLTESDPVDDVVWNVLPKYRAASVDVIEEVYAADIRRILAAFATDSKGQRDKLIEALRETYFVMVVDAGNDSKGIAKPDDVYFATERLKKLFAGVPGVLLVDDSYACLCGEDVRDLLEACGATRYLQPVAVEPDFTQKQRREMRRSAGLERCSWEGPIKDSTLRGLDALLDLFPQLSLDARREKAGLLWEALLDVANRRGSRAFLGEYTWGYSHASKIATFDAAFVRQLNATTWVLDAEGELECPEFVVFDMLGWKPDPFLESKIRFKLPIFETLAREGGFEPALLDLLKRRGITSVAELVARLGEEPEQPAPQNVDDAVKNILGDAPSPTPPAPDPMGPELQGSGGGSGRGGSGAGRGTESVGGGGTPRGSTGSSKTGGKSSTTGTSADKRAPGSAGDRPFISYVGTHPEDEESDLDGLDQLARVALEEQAITHILSHEPKLARTPTNNPGFDLIESDLDGKSIRWVEVKAMTGSLEDRPVGLSRTQFECAREHGGSYWLYVVEHAGDDSARIVRIQDPAGKARTFTFDHGWVAIANVDADQEDSEE